MVMWVPSLGPCFIFGPYPLDEIMLFQSHSWIIGGDVTTLIPPQQLAQPAVPQRQLAGPSRHFTQLTLPQELMEPTLAARADPSGHRFRLVNAKLPRPSLPKNTKWRIRNAKWQPPVPRHFDAMGRTSTWDLPPLGSKDYADNVVADMWEVDTQVLSENGSAADSWEEWEEVPAFVNEPRSEMPQVNKSRPDRSTIDNWEDWGEEVPVLVKEPCNKMPVEKSRQNKITAVNLEDKTSALAPVDESRLTKNTADGWENLEEEASTHVQAQCSGMPVNESKFDGDWGRAVIYRGTLAFKEDKSEQIKLTITGAQTFQMAYFDGTTYLERTFEATFRNDGRLFWDDGEVWCRKRKQVDDVQVPECKAKQFVGPAAKFIDNPQAIQVSPVVQSKELVTRNRSSGSQAPSQNICYSSTKREAALAQNKPTTLYPDVACQPHKSVVKRYEGIVKYFRGSFGWIQCSEIPNDIFLHKRDCVKKIGHSHERPKQWDKITFQLSTDEKGDPKAIEARIHVNDTEEVIDVREYFRRRKEHSPTLLSR